MYRTRTDSTPDHAPTFNVTRDGFLLTLTTAVVVGLPSLAIWQQDPLLGLFSLVAILGSACYGIYGYRIDEDALHVLRLGWTKKFPLAEIRQVEILPDAMARSIRVWGNGGIFGYIGHYRNRKLGKYRAYSTHLRKTVVITTRDETRWVVSPEDPQRFVQALQDALPRA